MTNVPVIITLPFPCPHCGKEFSDEAADSGDCGQRFRSIADSVPVIADSGSRRRLQGLTQRCRCQAFHANPPVDTSSRPILWFDRHHPSAPTRTRLVPARTVAVKDGPSSGHRVSGAQRP